MVWYNIDHRGGIIVGNTDFLSDMGQRIALRRKSLRLTQEDLAEQLGVSTQMISNLELGKKAVRPENLAHICEALNLSADFVLTGSHTSKTVDSIAHKLLLLTPEELQIINNIIDYMSQKH